MSISALSSEHLATDEQKIPDRKPWQRQKGESVLWFNRFNLYMDLGYKRSLQAAVEQERTKIKALKSTDVKHTPAPKLAKTRKNSQIREVPQNKAGVPGSWKHASIQWQWVERVRVWDAYVVEELVKLNMQNLMDNNHVLPMSRIRTLQGLLDATCNNYNRYKGEMSFEQDCMYFARMQSILRDIREEMKVFDETVQRTVMQRMCEKAYQTDTGKPTQSQKA